MDAYRTLLVPADSSPHSERALDHAIYLAKAVGAELHRVLAYAHPVPPAPPGEVLVPNDYWGTDRDEAGRRFEAAFSPVIDAGLRGRSHLVDDHPEYAITEIARELSEGPIAMGTRGRTGLARLLVGSVAERTLRFAPCPVLTVRAPDEDAAFDRLPESTR